MLWITAHLPRLPLEALLRGHASPEPWAVFDGRSVLACDARAQAFGVRAGMGLAAAWALAPQLRVRPRDEPAERAALEGIAAWMGAFTPNVSLEPPSGVLAEVEGSLRFFGGLGRLAERVRAGLAEMGFTGALAAAPTARGAWWLALAGRESLIADSAALRAALATLPVAAVCADRDAIGLLLDVGVRTIGELLALPREGVARRFGQALLDDLDRASGELPEPRASFVPPDRFAAKLELPAEVAHAEGLLFAARRLLVQLEGVLCARQAGVRRFDLTLLNRRARPRSVEVGLATPAREAERFVQLLRERLGRLNLAQPVEAIRIEAEEFTSLAGRTADLFRDERTGEEGWARLVERLQARLGRDAVHGLATHPDHRPERAWRSVDLHERPEQEEADARGPRPLWLIDPPHRLRDEQGVPHRDGPLELLAGPERLESGWWDEQDAARDYFIARSRDCTLLWIFRERRVGGWYLHGIFA
jgi:protein ImuB